jgi:hypothetical protein
MWNKLVKTIVLITLIGNASACAQILHPRLKPLKQLLGTWETSDPGGRIIETWKHFNPRSFTGRSIKVGLRNDTTLLEEIEIKVKDDDLFYIPTAAGQNSGKPVEFKLLSSVEGKYVFENKLHDFPQRIVYWLKSEDEVLAWVVGKEKGTIKKFEFNYHRIK